MQITVIRNCVDDICAIGTLSVDGNFQCYTLEPPVREIPGQPVASWKIDGQTAIPVGTYPVTISFSPHFGCDKIHINDIEDFSAVMIHEGNTVANTEGCTLVGETQIRDEILQSVAALAPLQAMVQAALDAGEEVYYSVS